MMPCKDCLIRRYCHIHYPSAFAPCASRSKVESTAPNTASDAISAIEGALRIKDLWRPPADTRITEDDPHWGEYVALQEMLNNFESVVRKQRT